MHDVLLIHQNSNTPSQYYNRGHQQQMKQEYTS